MKSKDLLLLPVNLARQELRVCWEGFRILLSRRFWQDFEADIVRMINAWVARQRPPKE